MWIPLVITWSFGNTQSPGKLFCVSTPVPHMEIMCLEIGEEVDMPHEQTEEALNIPLCGSLLPMPPWAA